MFVFSMCSGLLIPVMNAAGRDFPKKRLLNMVKIGKWIIDSKPYRLRLSIIFYGTLLSFV